MHTSIVTFGLHSPQLHTRSHSIKPPTPTRHFPKATSASACAPLATTFPRAREPHARHDRAHCERPHAKQATARRSPPSRLP